MCVVGSSRRPRLGFLVDFLSHAAIVGFMGGAAIVIGMQQLKGLLGLAHFTNSTDVVSVLKAVCSALRHDPVSARRRLSRRHARKCRAFSPLFVHSKGATIYGPSCMPHPHKESWTQRLVTVITWNNSVRSSSTSHYGTGTFFSIKGMATCPRLLFSEGLLESTHL